jgi:uncharacterized membrane protein
MQRIGSLLLIFLLIVFSYLAVAPLLKSGFYTMHDDTQVARVFVMQKALKDGMFPVRWVQDLGYGYGYPIFNFYAPLAYYVGGLLNLFGFTALGATKVMIVLGIVLAGIFMYLLAKEMWGEAGGFVAGILYIYAPYHALNVYVRGAIAEIWAYAFVPLVFYGLWKTYITGMWRYVVIGAVGYAGIILSHNLTAMMVTPFIFFVTLILVFQTVRMRLYRHSIFLVSPIFFGVLLAGFYWYPALNEMQFTNVSSQVGGAADFRNHFVCLEQLWSSQWLYGGSVKGCVDGLSFMLGKAHIVLAILAMIAGIILLRGDKPRLIALLMTSIFLLVSVFVMLDYAQPLWELTTLMAYYQYPWRFLLLGSFFSSLLIGALLYCIAIVSTRFGSKVPVITAVILSLGLALYYGRYFVPQEMVNKTSDDYTNEYALRWTASKLTDEYLPKGFLKPTDPADRVVDRFVTENGAIRFGETYENTQVASVSGTVRRFAYVRANIPYYPSWKAYIDGKPAEYRITNRGLIAQLPEGNHTLRFQFESTQVQQTGNILSIIGIFLLILGIIGALVKRVL